MATTRSNKSSPESASKAGTKRTAKASSSPPTKRGRPSKKAKEEQKTIEETMPDVIGLKDDNADGDEINDKSKAGETNAQDDKDKKRDVVNGAEQKTGDEVASRNAGIQKHEGGLIEGKKNAFDEVKADTSEVKAAAKEEQDEKTKDITSNDKSVVADEERASAIPSSILEKGIIYFFFRGRVGVEEPQGIKDVARSYIVLRPLPLGAKIGEGPLEDSGNARLLFLPKKMLPKSEKDRFLMFVEKPNASIKDLREQFASNEYATKTSG